MTDKTPAQDLRSALHNAGWRVAVHNDYRLHGEDHTFWLFTHADGRWIKGEGKTDAEAIAQAAALAQPAENAKGGEVVAITREMFDFLTGAGPLEGYHFGDKHEAERGAWWWRKRLHAMAATQPAGDEPVGLLEAVERFIADVDDGDRADAGPNPLMQAHIADFRAAIRAVDQPATPAREAIEAAAKVALNERVETDTPPDPTDVSYNMACEHIASATRNRSEIKRKRDKPMRKDATHDQ